MIENLPKWYPEARRRPVPGWEQTGFYTDSHNVKVVWHTTQGGSDPFGWYQVTGGIPHITIQADGTIDQHYSFHQFSRALRNLWGGVQTNLDGAIQIEIVGFAGTSLTVQQHEAMLKFTAWLTEHGVPARWIIAAPTRNRKVTGSERKMSNNEWDNGSGHCGHIQIPENDHVDPQFLRRAVRAIEAGFTEGQNRRKRKRITQRIHRLRSRIRALRLRRDEL